MKASEANCNVYGQFIIYEAADGFDFPKQRTGEWPLSTLSGLLHLSNAQILNVFASLCSAQIASRF
jgi:hypothetical protein